VKQHKERNMIKTELTLPQLAAIAGTRGLLGVGLGLLLAGVLSPERRRAIGWTLAAAGACSTIPLVVMVVRSRNVGSGS
jgi:hypothetical protein